MLMIEPPSIHPRRSRPRASLAMLVACGYALIALLAGGTELLAQTRSMVVALPITPGRELDLNVWTQEGRFFTDDLDHGTLRVARPQLTVAIWYHHRTMGTARRLFLLKVPIWPLAALAGGAALVAVCLWPRRSAPR
jgi:hypothetical protein